jgi:hypothetical protein
VSIAWLLSAQAKEGDEEKVTGTELSCCLLLHKSSQSLGQKNIYPQYLKDEHFIYIYILEIFRSLSLSLSLLVFHTFPPLISAADEQWNCLL